MKARKLGSDHIEQKLSQIYKIAEERQKEAYVATSDGTPTLRTHMLAHLKRTELLPHKTASDSRPYKRCVYTTRTGNTTIRSIQSWHTTNEGKVNGKDVTNLLNSWPLLIECGIFKPDTITTTPLHETCILVTCYMGWTPLPIKEAIETWIVIIKQNSKNGAVTKKIHSKLMQLYTQLRLAIYLRANLLDKINK